VKKWERVKLTHENSLAAYYAGHLDEYFNNRENVIMTALNIMGSGTDDEIAKFLGFDHKSKVQSRISDLIIDAGLLEEVGNKLNEDTGVMNRIVRIKPKEREAAIV